MSRTGTNGYSFPSGGSSRGYVVSLQSLIRANPDPLINEGRVSFCIAAAKPGYPGREVFSIDPGDPIIRTEKYSGDPTRFPARLKACARALAREGFTGRFHISHRNGTFSIVALPTKPADSPPPVDPERAGHLDHFYHLLEALEEKVGGKRYLTDCDGRQGWPDQGIYHFFEEGEYRCSGQELRVVRVGTHAVSRGSKSTLWNRLSAHRCHIGGVHEGGGNHRGSIFRLHVGTALIQRENLETDSWGRGSSAVREVRAREYEIETAVSRHIRAMPFLWIEARDQAGPSSVRSYLERNSIALLNNLDKPPIDPPSENWLGNYCPNEYVRKSGLWNVRHVKKEYEHRFLGTMEKLIDSM